MIGTAVTIARSVGALEVDGDAAVGRRLPLELGDRQALGPRLVPAHGDDARERSEKGAANAFVRTKRMSAHGEDDGWSGWSIHTSGRTPTSS